MIRIGIIGTGSMANDHAKNFTAMRGVKVVSCCDLIPDRLAEFAEKWHIPRAYTNYRDLLADSSLHAVSIVTPDASHAETALAAIKRGLHVMCEKPLAVTLADAKKMAAAAKRKGIVNLVNFSYRSSSALQAAGKLIAAGKIGRVMHVESSYLQSWLAGRDWSKVDPTSGVPWRLSTRHGSNGVLGDLGCHIYDFTAMLAGDIREIYCCLKTFEKVPGNKLGEYVLDANDSFIANVGFAGGAIGTIHSSRWATGHANSLRARVYGDKGAVEVDLDKSWGDYRICTGPDMAEKHWKDVKCRPTPNNYQRFIRAIRTGINDPNDFANGVKIQACLHASVESNKLGRMVKVPK